MIHKVILGYLQKLTEFSGLEEPRTWLAECYRTITMVSFNEEAFANTFSSVGRRLRAIPRLPSESLTAQLCVAGIASPDIWSVPDYGRVLLIIRALSVLHPDRHVEFVARIFRTGDCEEQQSVLRGLVLLQDPDRFTDIAINACRSNVRNVFEAVACNNLYPMRYFPSLNFNQLVLKALFIGTSVMLIEGLQNRCTSELSQMAKDYGNELKAAGRPVSDDIIYVQRLSQNLKQT